MSIARREKPAPRTVRRITHWDEPTYRLFLAFAEYLNESDDLDYALMAMVSAVVEEDAEFARWRSANPKAGELPKSKGKAKKPAERAAA
jgi:hypothetical protein